MNNIGICFSNDFSGNTPLNHIHVKRPVYERLLELIEDSAFKAYVLTRKTYQGGSVFNGVWQFTKGKFNIVKDSVKIDLTYDRVGGVAFPPENDPMQVVNRRDFKILAWDKFKTYKEIGQFMPKTFWVGEIENINEVIGKAKTEMVVVKPFNGLQGRDIFIGLKKDVKDFVPAKSGRKYILQEFVDTSDGIPNLTSGKHDLRIVIVNGKVVWCHVRVPTEGKLLANAAQGGILTEVDYQKVPESVKKIVEKISARFYTEYDNPIFSLDFGINKEGRPAIFEINDQIGFPKWEMKNRDVFLKALVLNFKSKFSHK